MRRFVYAVVAAMAMFPALASAQVSVGLRLLYGIPMGDAVKDQKMSDGISGQVPLQLDVEYKVTPQLGVGVYGSYAFGMLASQAKDNFDSASAYALGIQASYELPKLKAITPWVGLGTGYEWATASFKSSAGGGSLKYSGWEFARLEVGADYEVAKNFSTGLFVGYSLGQFSNASFQGQSASVPSSDKTLHEWFTFGIRGKYDI